MKKNGKVVSFCLICFNTVYGKDHNKSQCLINKQTPKFDETAKKIMEYLVETYKEPQFVHV